MTIEVKEKGSKEFYKEVVSVISQYKQLIKRPEAKLSDSFRSYNVVMFLMALLFAMNFYDGITDGFTGLKSAAVTATFIAFIVLLIYRINMGKMVEKNLSDDRASTVILDENGVEFSKEGSMVIRLAWNDVAFVRSFKEATCFLARSETPLVISITNKYKDEIMKYLEDNSINVRIIK